jgi:DNA mismatch repair protein MutS
MRAMGWGESEGLTPMMKQYVAIRRELPEDVILMFRLGDFYEMFYEDAKEAAPILDVALTKRNGMPMCGVPHHAADGYIGRLVKAGKRVAVAEQKGDPQPGRIVEREVTRIISAGTVEDAALLEPDRPNYLAAVYRVGRIHGLALVDHTTGEFRLAEFGDAAALGDELARSRPSETLVSEEQEGEWDVPGARRHDGYAFLPDQGLHVLKRHYQVHGLDGFGCGGMTAAVGAAGAILHYLGTQMRRDLSHLGRPRPWTGERHVLIDAASQANLELVQCRAGTKHTLLHALDRTRTPMGARTLRDWVLRPLRDLEVLRARQGLVGALLGQPFLLGQIQEGLRDVRDLERILGRLSQGGGGPRDLQSLGVSLARVPDLRAHLEALGGGEPLASALAGRLREFPDLVGVLEGALADEPPVSARDGGIFRDGYRAELDELRAASSQGKQWIAELQAREAERTGIRSLKIKYNAVFGYFIEITKSNLDAVPADYIRKQTTAQGERFVTPELKAVEEKILGADERARQLEAEEFALLRESVLEHREEIRDTAEALAELDVLAGLAETARLYRYCRPELNGTRNLVIVNGRHPVLDQQIGEEKFVPNGVVLDGAEHRLLLITGPNMAGKSTYIRQVALITLMAQIGSWVPAERAEIGLVDRIFTRVGANDDLSRGQSTFMVEMNETALIVNNATADSLVILDEIGRGTSTFDGLSIAWSVAEYLHDELLSRTLFATHYHELTALASDRAGVKNHHVAVREWNDEIVFLRRVVPGPADRSYGIQVARLAGLPDRIVGRAKEILAGLEGGGGSGDGLVVREEAGPYGDPAARRPAGGGRSRKTPKAGEEDAVPEGVPASEDTVTQLSLFS